MVALLKNGNRELLTDLRDVLYIIEEMMGKDIKDFIEDEFNEIKSDCDIMKEGLNDIKNEFIKLKNTFTEEQKDLLKDLETEIKNNIWWVN